MYNMEEKAIGREVGNIRSLGSKEAEKMLENSVDGWQEQFN